MAFVRLVGTRRSDGKDVMLSEWLEAGEEAELLVRYLALLAREGYRNVFSDRRASPPLGDRLPVDLELYELARGDVARRNGNGA